MVAITTTSVNWLLQEPILTSYDTKVRTGRNKVSRKGVAA